MKINISLRQVVATLYEDNLQKAEEAVWAEQEEGKPSDIAEEWTRKELDDAVEQFFVG